MLFKQILCGLAGAAMLAGCASTPPPPAAPAAPPTLASLMAEAEAALKAGQSDAGAALLTAASAAFPQDKAARLRLAQLQFESHDYGAAISHAQQVLARDPDDLMAYSILAVSGLRVASKALTDLAQKNDLTGSVRAEAQDLAKLLRANIGGEIIPALKPPAPKPATSEEHP